MRLIHGAPLPWHRHRFCRSAPAVQAAAGVRRRADQPRVPEVAQLAAPAKSAGTGFDPSSVSGTVILSGWARQRRGGDCSPEDSRRVRGQVPEHHAELPADRDRLSDGDGREVQRPGPARPVLRRLQRRPDYRPGRPPGARHDGRRARLRHKPVLRGLSQRVQGHRRQDVRLSEGRQHAGDGLQRRHARGSGRRAANQLGRADRRRDKADGRRQEGVSSTTASTGRWRSSTRTAARS